MIRYQAGDLAAAHELIEQLSPRLYRFFAVQTASRSQADDLLQETWLQLHRARQTYRAGEPVLAWVYGIARHVRLDAYRRTRRRWARERALDDLPPAMAATPTGGSEHRVEALLGGLNESQREIIVLLKVVGLSLEEAARATSSTVGAVKQRAHRAYAALREQLTSGALAAPAEEEP